MSLTAREAVEGVLSSEHADVIGECVALMVREIIELEVAQLAGGELGERAPAGARRRTTGIGTVAGTRGLGRSSWRSRGCGRAAICRAFCSRAGARSRRWWRRCRRCGNGVSTRKFDRLVEQMWLPGLSKGSGQQDVPRCSSGGGPARHGYRGFFKREKPISEVWEDLERIPGKPWLQIRKDYLPWPILSAAVTVATSYALARSGTEAQVGQSWAVLDRLGAQLS
jgi:hypothetical protein